MKTRAPWIHVILAFALALLGGAATAAAEAPTEASLAARKPAPISFSQDRSAARVEVQDPLAVVRAQAKAAGEAASGRALPAGEATVHTAYVRELYGGVLKSVSRRLSTETPAVVMTAEDYAQGKAVLDSLRRAPGEVPRSAGSVSFDGQFATIQMSDRIEVIKVEGPSDPALIVDHDKLLEAALKQLPVRFEIARDRPEKLLWNGKRYVIVEGAQVFPPLHIRRTPARQDSRVAAR